MAKKKKRRKKKHTKAVNRKPQTSAPVPKSPKPRNSGQVNLSTSTNKNNSTLSKNTSNQQKEGSIISKLIAVFIKDHKDNNNGHPHVIVDNVDDKHISVGLTTQKKKGQGRNAGTNYSLKNNPLNPEGEPTYMRRQATIDNKSNYDYPRTGKMEEEDYKKAKEYGEKAKQKYLDKKQQGKKE